LFDLVNAAFHYTLLFLKMLALSLVASAYVSPPVVSRPALGRTSDVTMQLSKKTIQFDQNGLFEGREVGIAKPPVRLLERIEELKLLSSLSNTGVLSSAEEAGLFSKLEAAGAFSTAEKLLPLADDLKLLSTAEYLLNVPSSYLFGIASLLLVGEASLIFFVPDDSTALVALQAVSAAGVGLAAVVLIATSYLFSLLQGDN